MRKSLKLLLSAAALAVGAGAVLTAAAPQAEARTSVFLGIGLPGFYVGPPAYYYAPPPPPPAYYYGPPPGYYYAPPPPRPPACRPRYDWRWNGYQWRQAYIGCW
jgi:hypothetical protein